MRRAKLKAHDVTRVIITSTMTHRNRKVRVDDLMAQRRSDGFFDLGWHYYVDRNARVHFGVPATERGSYFERYGRNSIVILVEGLDEYEPEQFAAIRRLIAATRREFPNAEPTLHKQLFRGVNPGFTLGELYESAGFTIGSSPELPDSAEDDQRD